MGGFLLPSPGSGAETLGKTETWNGSGWTEVADLNTARQDLAGTSQGSQTATLTFGGGSPSPHTAATESWNGSAWTEVSDLNTSRERLAGAGTSTAGIAIDGAQTPSPNTPDGIKRTEIWDGSSWTEVGDTNTAHYYGAAFGTNTAALVAASAPATAPAVNVVESWNGTSWTEVAELNTSRLLYGAGAGGPGNTSGLVFSGTPTSTATEEWTVPESISNLTITD